MEGTNVPWSWDGVIDNKRSNMLQTPPSRRMWKGGSKGVEGERREREGLWQDSLSTSLLTKANLKD